MTLIFDTKTTGKANFRAPASDPCQPNLVQIAAVLLDDQLQERAAFCFIIKPTFYSIPKEESDIHGITTEIAMASGIPLPDAMTLFLQFVQMAHCRVAHNLQFDDLIVNAAMHRLGDEIFSDDQKTFCTMQAMTPICALPGQYRDFKWPKLAEAYQYCAGSKLDGAHDALVDVRACATIYRWLQNRKAEVTA